MGSFRFGDLTWDTSSPFAFADSYAHGFRDFWRLSALQRWLRSSRRDAGIARNAGLRVTHQLLSQLRACAACVDGHARQIMCGGLSVEAHCSPVTSSCSCCGLSVIPSTEHILWVCPAWSHLRSHPQPSHPLVSRLGWFDSVHQHIVSQMGRIREAVSAYYYRHGIWTHPHRDRGGGGRGGRTPSGPPHL